MSRAEAKSNENFRPVSFRIIPVLGTILSVPVAEAGKQLQRQPAVCFHCIPSMEIAFFKFLAPNKVKQCQLR
jgi:hypothetical protein